MSYMVLEKPFGGWVNIHVYNFTDRASYLTDVPMDILQSLIAAYRHHTPAAVKFDAEGWEWILVMDDFDIHIISDDCVEDFTYCNYEVDRDDFVQKIICDILNYIDDWSAWGTDINADAGGSDAVNKRKNEILGLIEELKSVMKSRFGAGKA